MDSMNELLALYPKEYKLAQKALTMINDRFHITLPEDETGFICLHIVAAMKDQSSGSSLEYVKKIN